MRSEPTRIALVVGGHSPVLYDHDLSIGAYQGLMADLAAADAADVQVSIVHYIAPDGRLYTHAPSDPKASPLTVDALRDTDAASVADLPRALHAHGLPVHCLLYGENADAFYPGVEQFFGVPSDFGDIYGGAIGRHKWTQSLVANTLFPDALRPIPMHIVPVADGLDSPEARACLEAMSGRRCIVKSNRLHMSAHCSVIEALDAPSLAAAIDRMRGHDPQVLVQAFIEGKEYTCGCLRTAEDIIALPVLQIAVAGDHLDYTLKRAGGEVECIPCDAADPLVATMARVSVGMARFTGMGATSRSDFIVADGDLYYLETNVTPGLHDFSPYTRMLRTAGRDERNNRVDLLDQSIEFAPDGGAGLNVRTLTESAT